MQLGIFLDVQIVLQCMRPWTPRQHQPVLNAVALNTNNALFSSAYGFILFLSLQYLRTYHFKHPLQSRIKKNTLSATIMPETLTGQLDIWAPILQRVLYTIHIKFYGRFKPLMI